MWTFFVAAILALATAAATAAPLTLNIGDKIPFGDTDQPFVLDIVDPGRLLRGNDLANGATPSNLWLPDGKHPLPPSQAHVVLTAQERL